MPHRGAADAPRPRRRVAIVGGGYSGAACAIHFARRASAPLQITVIEPRAQLGAGVAYDTADPAHRLNVQDSLMVVYADAIDDFPRWLTTSGTRAADPQGAGADGQFYARRSDFARYMAAQVDRHAAGNASGSRLEHRRDRAVDLLVGPDGCTVVLHSGARIGADLVVLALGNEQPARPGPLSAAVLSHPGYHADPWAAGALDSLPTDAAVLLVGSGLTAADVVACLVARGHAGPLTAVSRRGLVPQSQGVFPGVEELLRRFAQPLPLFVQQHGPPRSVGEVLAWVRADARAAARRGESWHDALDAVRDAANYLWPRLPLAERQRYFRHLKPFYDTHRFRLAPQVDAVLRQARRDGQLTVRAARLTGGAVAGGRLEVALRDRHDSASRSEAFDAVVNCTGPNADPARSGLPLFAGLLARGVLAVDASGVGLAVDDRSRTLCADGNANPQILALGPLTRGRFAEVVAVPQITVHLVGLIDGLLADGQL